MAINQPTNFVNFTQTVALTGICSVALDMIEGGALGCLTTAVYDSAKNLLLSGGVDAGQPALTTGNGRHVSWIFTVPQGANALSWAVFAFAPVANAGSYEAQVTVTDTQGNVVLQTSFSGELTSFNDPALSGGVFLAAPQRAGAVS